MSRIIQDFDSDDLNGPIGEIIAHLEHLRAEGWAEVSVAWSYDFVHCELTRPHTAEEMAELEAEKLALIDAQAAHEEKLERAELARLNAKYGGGQ